MATQISGICENTVSICKNVFDISIIRPQIEITLACSPSFRIPENFFEPFTNVEEVVVNHLMRKKPSTTVIDLTGQEVKVQIIYNNDNQFTASWNGLMSGIIFAN